MKPNRPNPRARRTLATLVAPLTVMAGCSSASTPATDAGKTDTGTKEAGAGDAPKCLSFTPSSKESDIAAAIATTKDGACFDFAAGTYKFNNQLAFGTGNNVTMSGAGIGKTIFDFSGQVAGNDGIYAQSVKNLTLEKFTVRDTPGDGIKTESVTGVTFDTLEVTWTGADPTKHGSYGIYPVLSKNVLIENCKISGGNDSGIYVGQSQEIVVRNNEAFANVAGIEIENSYFADVYGNDAHDNTAGILVFSLPGLKQEGGHSVRVYSNKVTSNNGKNFAVKSDIVAILPSGTGSFVMACDQVEIFGNTYVGNETGALAVISYYDAQLPITDKNYYPYPSNVYFHDNTFMGNGTAPSVASMFGLLLITAIDAFPGKRVSDVFYDGLVDPKKPAGPNPMHICEKEPQANAVCDLHLDMLNTAGDNLSSILTCATPAASPFACTLPALPPVTFPGLKP